MLTLQNLSVGQTFQSGSHTLTAQEIKNYAAQFDPQPFHMDEEAASHSIFGGLVASGWHTASLSMRLIVESVELEGGLIGLGGTLRWLKPVRPDTTLNVQSTITAITPSQSKPGQTIVTLHCITRNAKGETLIEFEPQLMVFSKPT